MRRFVIAWLGFGLVAGAGCKEKSPNDAPAATTPPAGGMGSAVTNGGSATGTGSVTGTGGPGSAAAGSNDPWAAKPAPPPKVDTPETRKARAEAALGRVGVIKPKLAAIRELTFSRDVPTEYQLAADFKAYVHRETVKELPAEKDKNLSAALFHIGLLKEKIDLAEVEEQAVTTQAGAYYDPATKKFYLVMVPDNDIALDTITAHELTHGLQDQHFDLQKYMPPTLDDDHSSARRFVVEGDATFAMFLYAIGKPKVDPKMVNLLRGQIEQFANLDLDALKKQTKEQSKAFGTNMDPEIQKSLDAMDLIPPVVLVPMLDSYMKGALVVMTAFEQGGWKAVDDLYKNPPESTEQVLHPATKLYPTRDKPHVVTLAKLDAGMTELTANVIGELGWQIYFSLWKPELSAEASEGWGGDRYVVAKRASDGRLVGMFATTWDTPADAEQFAKAYLQTLPLRFPGTKAVGSGEPFTRPDAGKIFVKLVGKNVFIVDGADDDKALAKLMSTAKIN